MAKKQKWRSLTDEEIQYIIDNYHNTQTKIIVDKLQIPKKHLEFICGKYNLKKDKNFVVIRDDNNLTYEQCQFIFDNYEHMPNKEICKQLNIDYKNLRSFANNHRLIKNKYAKEKQKYTKEQIDYIKQKYPSTRTSIMEKELDIDAEIIRRLAFEYGIKKDEDYIIRKEKGCVLTIYQRDFIKDNYATMKTSDIMKKLNLTYEQINSYAKNLKIKKTPMASKRYSGYWDICVEKRKNENYNLFDFLNKKQEPKIDKEKLYKSKYGKYSVNQNYFNTIDNEWKAYWLGFLYADGCNTLNKNNKGSFGVKLQLQIKDKEHLQKFLNSLQSNTVIRDRTITLNNNKYLSSEVYICNKQMCLDLEKLGCVPKKSLILTFPNENQLPKKYYRDFIRGYFDGDGCIHINTEKQNIIWNLVGTKDFLNAVNNIFYDSLNIDKKTIIQKQGQKAYSLSYGSLVDIEKIYKYLYKDCNIYLERKLKKFDTLLCLD